MIVPFTGSLPCLQQGRHFYAFFKPARKPPQIRCGSSSRVSGEEFRRHLARIAAADLRRVSGSVPQQEKSAAHARTRMGPRPKRLCDEAFANLTEAPAPKERGVRSLSSRELRAKHAPARPRAEGGNPKGGAALFGQSLPTFCWPESRGPRAACEVPRRGKRVEGESKKFQKRKEGKKAFGKKIIARSLRSAPQG